MSALKFPSTTKITNQGKPYYIQIRKVKLLHKCNYAVYEDRYVLTDKYFCEILKPYRTPLFSTTFSAGLSSIYCLYKRL